MAHLRVDIRGAQSAISGGTCEPGEYYGKPLQRVPISDAVGVGVAGSGTVCSSRGRAAGLSTADIAQTDDRSGGQTRTEVPTIERTTPLDGETLYGPFIAIARAGRPGPSGSTINDGSPVALTITSSASGRTVFRARNVNTSAGIAIRALLPGAYRASWILRDSNGDTRTIRTGFVEAP